MDGSSWSHVRCGRSTTSSRLRGCYGIRRACPTSACSATRSRSSSAPTRRRRRDRPLRPAVHERACPCRCGGRAEAVGGRRRPAGAVAAAGGRASSPHPAGLIAVEGPGYGRDGALARVLRNRLPLLARHPRARRGPDRAGRLGASSCSPTQTTSAAAARRASAARCAPPASVRGDRPGADRDDGSGRRRPRARAHGHRRGSSVAPRRARALHEGGEMTAAVTDADLPR